MIVKLKNSNLYKRTLLTLNNFLTKLVKKIDRDSKKYFLKDLISFLNYFDFYFLFFFFFFEDLELLP